MQAPSPIAPSDFRLRSLLAPDLRLLATAYFLFGGAYIAYSTFAGARLAAAHAPIAMVSVTWVTFGLGIILGALLMIPVLQTPRLRRFTLPAALTAGAVGAWMAGGEGSTVALAGAFTVGLGVASTPALVTAQVRERVGAADYAVAHSYVSAALGVGQFIGPMLAGALADASGTASVPLMAAVVYAIAGSLALLDRWSSQSATES
jgi:predicted MFS family arabinose efflux permease